MHWVDIQATGSVKHISDCIVRIYFHFSYVLTNIKKEWHQKYDWFLCSFLLSFSTEASIPVNFNSVPQKALLHPFKTFCISISLCCLTKRKKCNLPLSLPSARLPISTQDSIKLSDCVFPKQRHCLWILFLLLKLYRQQPISQELKTILWAKDMQVNEHNGIIILLLFPLITFFPPHTAELSHTKCLEELMSFFPEGLQMI